MEFADTSEIIRDAIWTKRQVVATYRGYRREMCPHVLGWKHGRQQALFYQFGGGSKSGLDPVGSPKNWRCIPIDALLIHEIRDGAWHTAPNQSRPQMCVDVIVAEVNFAGSQTAGA